MGLGGVGVGGGVASATIDRSAIAVEPSALSLCSSLSLSCSAIWLGQCAGQLDTFEPALGRVRDSSALSREHAVVHGFDCERILHVCVCV